MNKVIIELYITGNSSRSEAAIRSVNEIFGDLKEQTLQLDVIDVLEAPELAEKEKVLATPTLIRRIPPPVRRLVGDLSNKELVKQNLEIK